MHGRHAGNVPSRFPNDLLARPFQEPSGRLQQRRRATNIVSANIENLCTRTMPAHANQVVSELPLHRSANEFDGNIQP
jgi:hypothetical protein